VIDPVVADIVSGVFVIATIAFACYFLLYQLIYITIVARAIGAIADERRWASDDLLSGTFASPLTPGVSVLVPAYNESVGVVACVESLLRLQYPQVQIIVVDDGSTDGTSEVLRGRYPMTRTDEAPVTEIELIEPIEEVWRFDGHDALLVRKVSAGRRADAVNAALRFARHELVCMIDGDSILEPTALLRVVQPFIDDPTVVASGGIVRPANGAVLIDAEVDTVEVPRTLIERIQVLEYLRAFLVGRAGWSAIKGLLIISGAFGVFRRDTLVGFGGLDSASLAEDAELVVAAHRLHRGAREPYRIVFVADPVCWTEVPATWSAVGRQRKRWSQGLGELLRGTRDLILRPRFGTLGMVTLPYFWLFEQWGAPIALLAFVFTVLTGALGLIPWPIIGLAIAVSYFLAVATSLLAVAIELSATPDYRRGRSVLGLVTTAFIEPIVFYFPHAVWRSIGLMRAILSRPSEWGAQTRSGFVQRDETASARGSAPDARPDR
jgi:cellulose synthase/poly-beta-1,6-N-acetylglucosamine synthase-like glycosyltransferase